MLLIVPKMLTFLLSSGKEIYRIKLPGAAKIGEGKPENQNHAIVFTRGEALQAIDMNQVNLMKVVSLWLHYAFWFLVTNHFNLLQDNYLEEAFKMRNLLEEFHEDHGVRPPTILGVREHIFTGRLENKFCFRSLVVLHQNYMCNHMIFC